MFDVHFRQGISMNVILWSRESFSPIPWGRHHPALSWWDLADQRCLLLERLWYWELPFPKFLFAFFFGGLLLFVRILFVILFGIYQWYADMGSFLHLGLQIVKLQELSNGDLRCQAPLGLVWPWYLALIGSIDGLRSIWCRWSSSAYFEYLGSLCALFSSIYGLFDLASWSSRMKKSQCASEFQTILLRPGWILLSGVRRSPSGSTQLLLALWFLYLVERLSLWLHRWFS